jgi:hypothetical protein
VAIVALDQLLAFAHAGRRVALGVLVDKFDRLTDEATLRIGELFDQLAGADDLAAEERVAAGDHGRDADLDRRGGGRVPQIGGRGDQRGSGRHSPEDRAPRCSLTYHHGFLPDD